MQAGTRIPDLAQLDLAQPDLGQPDPAQVDAAQPDLARDTRRLIALARRLMADTLPLASGAASGTEQHPGLRLTLRHLPARSGQGCFEPLVRTSAEIDFPDGPRKPVSAAPRRILLAALERGERAPAGNEALRYKTVPLTAQVDRETYLASLKTSHMRLRAVRIIRPAEEMASRLVRDFAALLDRAGALSCQLRLSLRGGRTPRLEVERLKLDDMPIIEISRESWRNHETKPRAAQARMAEALTLLRQLGPGETTGAPQPFYVLRDEAMPAGLPGPIERYARSSATVHAGSADGAARKYCAWFRFMGWRIGAPGIETPEPERLSIRDSADVGRDLAEHLRQLGAVMRAGPAGRGASTP